MKIELSIIIPMYNVEKYLDKCLSGIEKQCDSSIEVICIDDGSPDSCYQICEKYKGRIENFTLLRQKNAGVSAARNKGLELAAGEWIWFVDPDDWIEDNAIQEIKELNKEKCDVIGFKANIFHNNKCKLREFVYDKKYVNGKVDVKEIGKLKAHLISLSNPYLICRNLGPPATHFLYNRAYLLYHRCKFDSRLIKVEDVQFLLNVLDGNPNILFVDNVLYTYNVDNLTSVCNRLITDAVNKLTPCLEVLEEYIDLQNQDYSDAFRLRKRVILTEILLSNTIHPDNPEPLRIRKKEWKEIISLDMYRDCLCVVPGEALTLKGRIKCFLMRNNCLLLLRIYYTIYRYVNDR